MNLVSLSDAIPKIAVFLLLIVSGTIIAEVVYLLKKKKGQQISPPPPITVPPESTPKIAPVGKKSRLTRKTLAAFLIMFLLVASIPAAVILVKQRQEVRERAYIPCEPACSSNERCVDGICVPKETPPPPPPTPPPPPEDECSTPDDCSSPPGCTVTGCSGSPRRCRFDCQPPPSPTPPPAPPPTPPPPPPGCSNKGSSCDDATGPKCCGSLVCNFGTCIACSDIGDEPLCWTHGEKCYWINGSCQNKPSGTPPPGTGNISCSGTSVKNNTNQTLSCGASYFSCKVSRSSQAECEANPFCGGSSSSTNFTLAPGASKSFPDSSGIRCGVWQNDFTVDCGSGYSCSGGGHNCNWDQSCDGGTPPPTTPPSYTAMCQAYGVYDTSWNPITDLSTLTVGQTVYFTTRGSTNEPSGLTKARFRINSGSWQETTNKHGNEFYVQYTIPATGSFKVESMVFNPSLGWR